MPAGEALPPEAYAWWVPALGVALLAAVALWSLWVRRRTRPAAAGPAPAGPAPTVPAGVLRARYTAEVEAHHAAYRAGTLDLRALHLALARTMRDFASARTGRDVRAWTRADVAGYDPTRRLGSLLAVWEEPAFARRSDAEAAASVAGAREVIARW
ncbi:hypothetical protein MF406_17750 [Georgenia sp. TF02-10]|uniref:hypothetical protein n=1 Tax=Georgenia sp. TF02-10 TaxID=2917725 RepID=UPI001FA7D118|nr:hypothetical protein [Georgenia sp. TF02-10]UNX54693.1 hypothetical protein MF406_17750 [Georgenia sp. TF02-10]